MTNSLTHAESILIAASPEEVYATVSDVTRTGEWSPVCQECWWEEGEPAQLGSIFKGRNVTPERTWETRSEVIAADRGRAFGWSVEGGRVFWSYTMQPNAGGTLLTESWEFTAKGLDFFAQRFGADAPTEIEHRRQSAETGIPVTLRALKQVIEAEQSPGQ